MELHWFIIWFYPAKISKILKPLFSNRRNKSIRYTETRRLSENRNRSEGNPGEIKRVVNNFLQMLDNFKGDSILFAATNHQNMLDSAIWRRFDAVIDYDLPNEIARQQLFEYYLRPLKRDKTLNLNKAAQDSNGLSPADIKMIAVESMKSAIIDQRDKLSSDDLICAIKQFIQREKIKQGS